MPLPPRLPTTTTSQPPAFTSTPRQRVYRDPSPQRYHQRPRSSVLRGQSLWRKSLDLQPHTRQPHFCRISMSATESSGPSRSPEFAASQAIRASDPTNQQSTKPARQSATQPRPTHCELCPALASLKPVFLSALGPSPVISLPLVRGLVVICYRR